MKAAMKTKGARSVVRVVGRAAKGPGRKPSARYAGKVMRALAKFVASDPRLAAPK